MTLLLTRWFKSNLLLVIIFLSGLALRLYHLTAISLWHDEAFSALLIRYPWREMFYRIGLDVHPPMYYIFLRLWHYVFGNSLGSLRGFSAFFGLGLIIVAYGLVKTAFKNQRLALVAALLVAVNPFQISYVTEARMYTMGAFFAVLAAWFLVKALELQKTYFDYRAQNIPNLPQNLRAQKTVAVYYLLFALAILIIIYTHYYLLFTAVALGLYALLYHWHAYGAKFRNYIGLVLSCGVVGIGYLPWLKAFLFQLRQVGDSYWIPAMTRWSIPDTLWQMLLGLYTGKHLLLAALSLLIIVIIYFVIRKIASFNKWLILFNVLAPFAGAVMFAILAHLRGESSSVYLLRYFLFCSTFFLILISLWLEEFRPRKAGVVLLVDLVTVNLIAFTTNWRSLDVKNHKGMSAAADLLVKNVEWNHKLYVGSSFEFFNLKYYLHQNTNFCDQDDCGALAGVRFPRPLLYSGGKTDVSQMPHYAGTAILTNADLVADFKTATKNGDTVWLLWTNGFGGSKPEVPANWTQIDEKGYAEIRPYLGTWVVVTEYKVN